MGFILPYSQKHSGASILGCLHRINFSDDLTDDAKNIKLALSHRF